MSALSHSLSIDVAFTLFNIFDESFRACKTVRIRRRQELYPSPDEGKKMGHTSMGVASRLPRNIKRLCTVKKKIMQSERKLLSFRLHATLFLL